MAIPVLLNSWSLFLPFLTFRDLRHLFELVWLTIFLAAEGVGRFLLQQSHQQSRQEVELGLAPSKQMIK